MTREQALSIKILTFDFEENPIEEPLPSEMILVVNSIYDSLETQTCKSCKHSYNTEFGLYCGKFKTAVTDIDFCSRYEKETK